MSIRSDPLLLGVDGGGSSCRARLTTRAGAVLGCGTGGPANIRLGVKQSFASVLQATAQCMSEAGLSARDLGRVVACLALAGASEPTHIEAARRHKHPFQAAIYVTDAEAACIGAHEGCDGGIIVVGTGSIGWAQLHGRQHRVGGWGWPVSDEGSGAWLGCEALRRTLWAHDQRIPWTELLTRLFARFRCDPHDIVRWMAGALPRDFASLAPAVVESAAAEDPVAIELLQLGAGHIDALAQRLVGLGVDRLSLVGGLASAVEPWLAHDTRRWLLPPRGDAVAGALRLASDLAETSHATASRRQ